MDQLFTPELGSGIIKNANKNVLKIQFVYFSSSWWILGQSSCWREMKLKISTLINHTS